MRDTKRSSEHEIVEPETGSFTLGVVVVVVENEWSTSEGCRKEKRGFSVGSRSTFLPCRGLGSYRKSLEILKVCV